MASRTVSKARALAIELVKEVAQEAACEALITVAAYVARRPMLGELIEGLYGGYAWGMALGGFAASHRDSSWESVEARTAVRARELEERGVLLRVVN